jgi:hypothetical protein
LISITGALLAPVILPLDGKTQQNYRLERLLGHGEREGLDLCQT